MGSIHVLLVNKDVESSSPVVVEVPPHGQTVNNVELEDKLTTARKAKVSYKNVCQYLSLF